MVSGLRNQALALACVRHALPVVHGRGTDQLPHEVKAKFDLTFVKSLDAEELARAFRFAVDGFLDEVRCADAGLAARLQGTAALLKQSLRDVL